MSDHEVAELVEYVEAHELEELVAGLSDSLVTELDLRVERIGAGVALVVRKVDVPMLNRIVGLGLREPITESTLDQVVALFEGAGIRYIVQLVPAVVTPEIERWLVARQMPRLDQWSKLIRGAEAPPTIPTDLRVERIGVAHAEAFADIVCDGFEIPRHLGAFASGTVGRPGWSHYLAFDGERPVATGALLVHEGVGWLDYGATQPSHQRRGAQGAIMAQRIRDGLDLGCHHFVTAAEEDLPDHPNPSYHNMIRTGFRLVYQRPNYIYFPPSG